MASKKKWFGLAAIGAALAGIIARIRGRSRVATEPGDSVKDDTDAG
jgi:hypothetical protein